MITNRDRVKVSPTFPTAKLDCWKLCVGDVGTVVWIATIGGRVCDDGIALVNWDKGYNTTANTTDLERV